MKKILIFIFALVLLVGLTTALSFSADSKMNTIYTSTLCSFSNKCDGKTPVELDVDFEIDSKTGLTKVDYDGIMRST